eukprot:TRINITY_DN9185_c0_g1_i1.p1 TRINITY_DN9185_c0_g1~~TRINITY_DN9185_c0_g1_i1.p1  ORF type:complete len:885 (+),score=284.07 TRINITY_DN9185_c0_g1_i1:74-2728(+)
MAGAGDDDMRRLEDEVAEDDILGEEVADEEEDADGEELFGDNMLDDYRDVPELDQYDPEMLDESGAAAPLTIEQRLAAERAMNERDGAAAGGGRRRPLVEDPMTPGGPLRPSSPGASEFESPGDMSEGRRVRRRLNGDDDDIEEDLPESSYDLNSEERTPGSDIEPRLQRKIMRSFSQFIRKFIPEGQTEPKYPDLLRKMGEENEGHLDVHFNHIQQWSARLALWIADEPQKILPLLNEQLMTEAARRFDIYANIKRNTDEQHLRVGIHSFPIQDKIRDLNSKAMNKLVCVHGVCTKRSNVQNQVKRLFLRCAKCNSLTNAFEVADEKDLRPSACVDCSSRGPWRVDRQKTLYRNYQKITLQESPSSVEPGKMPRSKDVILHGDLADTVRPGDEMSLTAIYKGRYDPGTNARTCFPVYKTELEAVHIKKRGDMKAINISDEQLQQILDLARSPNIRERIIASIAPSIYGMPYVKTAIALSMFGGQRKVAAGKHRIRGDLNTLIVGDPGLAKSQFLKYVEQTFPKAVYTTGKGASAVGLTAALTRDDQGDWCLEGGAMVLADDGVCLIDEFDKMNDQDRTSLHEAMEQQTISISKAGIVATLQARCAVIAVANPVEGRYDPSQTFSQNVNLTDPILSRFDLLCVLRDEADPVQDERLADHVVCSHIRSHPEATAEEKLLRPKLQQKTTNVEPLPQDVLQRYIVYARQRVFPKVMDLDKEKLANFYKDIRAEAFRSGGAPMTARHVESIIRMAEANARMELRQHVNSRDLDHAISIVLESFIQSQKLQVAEELRKRFRRYIRQMTPMADQIMDLLDKLFKSKIESRLLSRPGELPPEVSEVSVDMAEVVAAIERNDLDLDEAHAFMRTPRFAQNFREENGRLWRIV